MFFTRLGLFMAGLNIPYDIWLYLQTGDWQILAVGMTMILSILLLLLNWQLIRLGYLNIAAYMLLLVIVIAYSVVGVVVLNVGFFMTVSGSLLILLTSIMAMPTEWRRWGGVIFVFLLLQGLIYLFSPIQGIDVADRIDLSVMSFGTTVVGLFGFVIYLFRYQGETSLRYRLILYFGLMAVVTATLISFSTLIITTLNSREQALTQLEFVANLKQRELDTWLREFENTFLEISTQAWLGDYLSVNQEPRSEPSVNLPNLVDDTITAETVFTEIIVLNLQGQPILSSLESLPDRTFENELFFQRGQNGLYLHGVQFVPGTDDVSLILTAPIQDRQGNLQGVLLGYVNISPLNFIITQRAGLGATGVAYLVDTTQRLITPLDTGVQPGQRLESTGLEQALNQQTGSGIYQNNYGEWVLGLYQWLPELNVAFLIERNLNEVLENTLTTLGLSAAVAMLTILLSVGLSLWVASRITTPIGQLASIAGEVANGNLDLTAPVESDDEIGQLAQAFNSMTEQLREDVKSLEERIVARTQRLELVAALGEKLNLRLDLDSLLTEAVSQIQRNFNYYHTQIYLSENNNQTLHLAKAQGQITLAPEDRHTEVAVDDKTNLIARAARTGQIARENINTDTQKLAYSSFIAEARSEMAVPIMQNEQVLGVLDVQQRQAAGLDIGDMSLLRSVANQIAVAINNARLFQEVETALQEAQRAQARYQKAAWSRQNITPKRGRYHYIGDSDHHLSNYEKEEIQRRAATSDTAIVVGVDENILTPKSVAAPVKVRDHKIGTVQIHNRPGQNPWTEDDLAIVNAVIDQLAQVADNLRLFDETREQASREQTIRQITDRLRSASNLNQLLDIATETLSQELSASHVRLKLGLETPPNPTEASNNGSTK